MNIEDRKRVLYQVIKHLMDKGFVNMGKLSQTLPKDTLETLTRDEQLERFVEVLELQDVQKSLMVDKPLVENFIWNR
jgi:DNA-binding transcriptional regulator of glucitol operon